MDRRVPGEERRPDGAADDAIYDLIVSADAFEVDDVAVTATDLAGMPPGLKRAAGSDLGCRP